MDIVVLAGGLSPERDVSLTSGCMVANALVANGHRVLLADLYDGLPTTRNFKTAYNTYKKDVYKYRVPEKEPDLEAVQKSRSALNSSVAIDTLIGDNIMEVCADADITFLALHGSIGENGKLQAAFDIFGVRYTGTGYDGSFIAMDKLLSKEIMRVHDVKTPDWMEISGNKSLSSSEFEKKQAPLEFPCVIKPCACGSSVGVSIVSNQAEFDAALAYAAKYETRLICERKIEGREFSVGVLGGNALPPIEIIPTSGFYDYVNKYQPGATIEKCPPLNLSLDIIDKLKEMALTVHNKLRLGDYSRVDIMLDGNDDLYCLEANTLPGMTPTSLLPQEAAAAGVSYNELCEKIIKLACARYNAK